MTEILELAIKLWVMELSSKSEQVKQDALYDAVVARRAPENVPLLVLAALSTGLEPDEILTAIEKQASNQAQSGRKRSPLWGPLV